MTKSKLMLIAGLAVVVLASAGAAADTFAVSVVSQTNSTITLGWSPQPGYGYLFSSDGVLVSRTNDPSRASVKFSKNRDNSYDVDVITKGANGHCCNVAPPPPTASITQTIANGSTISDITAWRAVYDANGDGVGDDPGKVEFYIDGTLVLTEINAPFGDTFATGNPSTTVGQHTFLVRAVSDAGALLATNSVTATVASAPPPPPPSGYPNASNTGVPAGTTLTTYTGPTTITAANTVIDGKIMGCMNINAPGVVIRNSRISCNGSFPILVNGGNPGAASVLIEDSDLDCQNQGGTAIAFSDVTARRVDISKCENGFSTDQSMTIEDSYIHELFQSATAHPDGIQCDCHDVTIRHNTIYGTNEVTGAIGNAALIFGRSSSNANILIENNLLAGGGYTVYCVQGAKGNNFVIRNNAFSTKFGPKVGYYGPSTDCSDETQSGNFILETGQQITLG